MIDTFGLPSLSIQEYNNEITISLKVMKLLSAFKKIISIVWLLHEALANYESAASLMFRKDHVNICTKSSYHSRSYCFYHNFLGY